MASFTRKLAVLQMRIRIAGKCRQILNRFASIIV